MLNKGAFALEIVRGDPELTADCRVTLNRGDRIGSLDCILNIFLQNRYSASSKEASHYMFFFLFFFLYSLFFYLVEMQDMKTILKLPMSANRS